MLGVVTLPVKVQDALTCPCALLSLKAKGPRSLWDFPFLEDNQLVVDCTARRLTRKDGTGHVRCLPVQTAEDVRTLARPHPDRTLMPL